MKRAKRGLAVSNLQEYPASEAWGRTNKMDKMVIMAKSIFYQEYALVSAFTFRNSQGELVDMHSVPATRLKNEFGSVLEKATRGGAVAITRHDTPKAVLISFDEFQALVKARSHSLNDLEGEFDGLLARMQTPKARKGMEAAFSASPSKLGRIAVKAARPRTKRRV